MKFPLVRSVQYPAPEVSWLFWMFFWGAGVYSLLPPRVPDCSRSHCAVRCGGTLCGRRPDGRVLGASGASSRHLRGSWRDPGVLNPGVLNQKTIKFLRGLFYRPSLIVDTLLLCVHTLFKCHCRMNCRAGLTFGIEESITGYRRPCLKWTGL